MMVKRLWMILMIGVCGAAICSAAGDDWAVDSVAERSFSGVGEIEYMFAAGAEPDSLWFEAKRSIAIFGKGSLKMAVMVNGSWEALGEYSLERDYKRIGGIKLNSECTAVKLYSDEESLITKYVKNVKVNNRRGQEIVWEQELHNILIGDTVLLTAKSTSGMPVMYTCGDVSVCEVMDSFIVTRNAGRTILVARQEGDLFNYAAEAVVCYVNVNLVSEMESVQAGESELILYPNPCVGRYINIVGSEIESVEVFYVGGGVKMHSERYGGERHVCVDVGDLPMGYYIIKVLYGDKEEVLNLIIK